MISKILPIMIDKVAVTVCGVGLESFTCTVKLDVPGPEAVPEMTPRELSDMPLGSDPLVIA